MVLVVVSSVEGGVWLMDAAALLAADRRAATVCTVAPVAGAVCPRTTEFLAARGLPTVPWRHAIRREFDLVLAADTHGLAQLRGKKLLFPRAAVDGPAAAPDVLALTHDAELPVWSECCPATTTVVGDLCYDRLIASIPFRADYRRVFGLSSRQRLIAVESTVDVHGLLRGLPPRRYRVAALRPDSWRATLVAADVIVGDLGAATRYGAAIGLPVLVVASADDRPRPDGATELVRRHARRLRVERSPAGQLEAVRWRDRAWQDRVAGLVTAKSGRAADLLRSTMYTQLGLAEPTRPGPCFLVTMPRVAY